MYLLSTSWDLEDRSAHCYHTLLKVKSTLISINLEPLFFQVTRLPCKEGRTHCADSAACSAFTGAMPRILHIAKATLPGSSQGQEHPPEQRRRVSSLHNLLINIYRGGFIYISVMPRIPLARNWGASVPIDSIHCRLTVIFKSVIMIG